MPFEFSRLEISDVILIKPKVFGDARGKFMEVHKQSDFQKAGIEATFIQENYSYSSGAVLRGLHYQKSPKGQGKLVRVTNGEIFDVAVDLRKGSPTYGCWVGEILSSANNYMLYIPIGFAHGFCTISSEVEMVYKITGSEYAPEYEAGINWNDPTLKIPWPIDNPILNERDTNLPYIEKAENNFVYDEDILK